MFRSFNFWYVFAPLGAFVAAYIGYKRSHRNGKHYERLDVRSAWLDIVIASLASTILCALFYIESHRGLVELFIGDGSDGLRVLFGAVCVVIAPPIVSAFYGWSLWRLGHRFAKVGVCHFYCRATPRRDKNGEIRYIIDTADLARAIAAAIAKDRRTRRILEGSFKRAQLKKARAMRSESLNLNQPKVQTAETPRYAENNQQTPATSPVSTDTTTAVPCATRPAPSEKLVKTMLYGPDGSSREIEVPENRVADLQLAMLRYRNTMAQAQAMISSALKEADEIKRQRACLERRAEFDAAVRKLDPDDQKLINQTLTQYPLLWGIIESGNVHLRARFVGTGVRRQVRFYSLRVCAAS